MTIEPILSVVGEPFKASMFQNLITLTTMISVVLHALLGCCVHHAHAWHTHAHDVDQGMMDIPYVVGLDAAGHDHEGHCNGNHEAACQHPRGADGSGTGNCFDDDCAAGSKPPCSGSHGPHEGCDEADCNIVADQRDVDISLLLTADWSPLLTYGLSLSPRELLSLRTGYGSPPDPHGVQPPLRLKTQVWRL